VCVCVWRVVVVVCVCVWGGGGPEWAVRPGAQKGGPGTFGGVFGPIMVVTQGAACHPRIPGK
jgi:hypothetical protein